MSTLKATNIKNESSASNNIVLDSGGGVVVSGILTATTFSGNVTGDITIGAGSTSAPSITPSGDSNTGIFFPAADTIAFAEGGTEVARFDSSGRLGVGTASPTAKLEIHDGSGTAAQIVKINSGGVGLLSIQSGTTTESRIEFGDSANDDAGYIYYNNSTDYMQFGVNGAERMRIANLGTITHTVVNGVDMHDQFANDTGYDRTVLTQRVNRSASTDFNFLESFSSNTSDKEFQLRGSGTAQCDGSWNGGGADYAEYFEWSDGNATAEDRRGISVVLDGDKIREAVADEEPIGVISGNPSVVGDAAWNKWNGKYLRDDFGSYVQNEEGERQLNPAFDPDAEYIPREQRPEWDAVGLMGKLRIRKGQVTGSRWIKMRDISDTVEEWLVR